MLNLSTNEITSINGPTTLNKTSKNLEYLNENDIKDFRDYINKKFSTNDSYKEYWNNELNNSIKKKDETKLIKDIINVFLTNKNKTSVVVTYGRNMEAFIFNNLEINSRFLNIQGTLFKHDNKSYIILIDLYTKKKLVEINIGLQTKPGRNLSLNETHMAICMEKHTNTSNNIVKNVELIKCIFNYIITYINNSNNNNNIQ